MGETFEGLSDGDIIRHYQVALAAGDSRAAEAAFDALFRRCCPELTSFLEGKGLVRSELERILQEVWLAALAVLPPYEDRGLPFLHWLKKTAANRLKEARGDAQRDRKHLAVLPDLYEAETSRSGEEDPLDILMTRETRAEVGLAIRNVLGELSARDQGILLARFNDGLSSREVAERFDVTAVNVDAICSRTRDKLRAVLIARYGLEQLAAWVGWHVKPEGRRTAQRAATEEAHGTGGDRYEPQEGNDGKGAK